MAKPFLKRVTKTFFLICNLFISVLFLAGANIQYFSPLRWWFMGVFAILLPYIIILLLIFFAGWLFAKSAWLMLPVITLILGWQAVKNIIPFNSTAKFVVKKDTNTLRIMSWNVEQFDIQQHKKHPEIKVQMLELINQYKPDIACFQEMVGADYNRTINYLGDFKRVLQFDNYYYSYNVRLDFDDKHHFGIIIFSRYPFINKQTISPNPGDYNSTFQYTDIIAGSDTIRIFNIHLASIRFTSGNLYYLNNPNLDTDTTFTESKNIMVKLKYGFLKRSKQADRVREELNKSPYPVIVCGDFNDVPNSYAYNTIGKNLQNAFVKKGVGIGRTFTGISPTLRIDNIFVDKKFSISQFTRIKKKLSDHFPIIADVSLLKTPD
ncbi:MAG: endonuclease/exonuclease/phosphatase family protein [Ginsengibacter sp.]